MSQLRHPLSAGKRGFSCCALALLLSVLLLGCGGGQATGPLSAPEQGAEMVTAWAKQGTVFPELAATTTKQASPATGTNSGQASPLASSVPTSGSSATTRATTEVQNSVSPPPTMRPSPSSGPGDRSLEPVGRLSIPSLDLDVSVVEVSWHLDQIDGQAVAIWDTVPALAGHHRGTAAPGGTGNCVISGHSQTQGDEVFNNLWTLEPGALIVLTDMQDKSYEYVVTSVDRIQELGQTLAQRLANASAIAPTQDARLTLVTCWPDWAYTHRVVIVAQLR